MKFKEQFPSLNKAIVDNNETFPDIEFMLKVIEVHCLDKQRVTEALEKCREKLGPDYVGIRTFHTLMIEELGL